MPFSLLPKQMVSSLTDVTAESLLKKGEHKDKFAEEDLQYILENI